MPRVARAGHGAEPLVEKDFYLEEFRGRSVLIAVAPSVAAARTDLNPVATTAAELIANGTRVLLWWPAPGPPERRLLAALRRARAIRRRRGEGRQPAPVLRADATDSLDTLRAPLWGRVRRTRLSVLTLTGATETTFARLAGTMAVTLRVPKLVLVEPGGGLLAAAPSRLSFVDENVLDTLLRQGEAEWSGLGDRRPLLVAVRDALRGGVEAVNLCTPEGIADELFTYVGSGTLFTQGDYCHVASLGIDDFAQAERLLLRGQREGVLKSRTPEEIAEVLAVGFGATLAHRHLAGVAGLLTAPYAAERVGEIVGLYTITRFKGEGIGERLVSYLLAEAEQRGLLAVFACTLDQHARQFFLRLGFERVGAEAIPPVKWCDYDPRRRARIVVLRRRLAASAAAVPVPA